MTDRAILKMLIAVAREKSLQAGRQLRRITKDRDTARQQLTMLQAYRTDYTARLCTNGRSGLSGPNYRNFRRFLETLDQAIHQQNSVLALMESSMTERRNHWAERTRRLNAAELLLTRQTQQLQTLQCRIEQRVQDEQASRHCRTENRPAC